MPIPTSVNEYTVVTATSFDELWAHVSAWRELADHALEDNAYLHPDFVLSAFEYSQFEHPPLAVFVYRATATGRKLAAVALFEICPRSWSIPFPHLRTSAGKHGYLVRPLLCGETPVAAFGSLCKWLARRSGGWHAVVFRHLAEESPVGHTMLEFMGGAGYSCRRYPQFRRAVIRAAKDYSAFLETLSARRRQDLRRLRRRMEECGAVELRCFDRYDADPEFTNRFITLESKSWKSAAGTTIIDDPDGPHFFDTLAQRFGERSALLSCELLVNGQPVAMSQNLLGRDTMFALKIAFDATQRKLSPGIVLAVECIEQLIRSGKWNADGGNSNESWLNRLWPSAVHFDSLVWSISPHARLFSTILSIAKLKWSWLGKNAPPSNKDKY